MQILLCSLSVIVGLGCIVLLIEVMKPVFDKNNTMLERAEYFFFSISAAAFLVSSIALFIQFYTKY